MRIPFWNRGKVTEDTDNTTESVKEEINEGMASKTALMKKYEEERKNHSGYQSQLLSTALSYIYTNVSQNKSEIIRSVDSIKNFYLVEAIVDIIIEDAFGSESGDGKVINVTSENPKIKGEIEALDEKLNFDNLVTEVAPEILYYGEFIYKVEFNKKKSDNGNEKVDGIKSLIDSVNQENIVAVEKAGEVEYYLYHTRNGIRQMPVSDYIRFCYGKKRIRTRVDQHTAAYRRTDQEALEKIPNYIRVGKSIIYPILDKLRDLKLQEALVPASKLAKLTSGSIVGVNVPANISIDEAKSNCKEIEGIINNKIGLDKETNEINIADIISSSGKIKVVPIFGDKGNMNRLDYKSDEPDDLLSSIEDLRRVCCSSIGYPYELLFGGDSSDKKGELLKRYARYLTKLKNIRFSIKTGIEDICLIHLVNSGISCKRSDIDVSFTEKLVHIGNTESLEFLDMTLNYIQSLNNFLNDLATSENLDYKVNKEQIKEFMNTNLDLTGLNDLIASIGDKDQEDGGW